MFTELDKQIIRELQEDLPLTSRPYKVIADKIGITEEELLAKVQEFVDKGIIRRFGAALRHREVGFTANAMVVWDVPDEKTREVGAIMAGFPEVSHCYQRPRYPGWPYNMFTMVHGLSKEECEATAARIAERTGIKKYDLLYSTAELKKDSMKYFMEE
ncbi:siroheme decarboxylase subunit beta [Thermincola potens]|uniref:siroheme decarboxylase n=1 Tax=Thermincola potens (strain JR) TaxID=635013 RepID=D5XED4_THEPJ|nr:AsnC family transcriptional regulator [Thermincola potens]ADG82005.1 putative transcriptional regulator, AsnC family [Thermincola potens JR]